MKKKLKRVKLGIKIEASIFCMVLYYDVNKDNY